MVYTQENVIEKSQQFTGGIVVRVGELETLEGKLQQFRRIQVKIGDVNHYKDGQTVSAKQIIVGNSGKAGKFTEDLEKGVAVRVSLSQSANDKPCFFNIVGASVVYTTGQDNLSEMEIFLAKRAAKVNATTSQINDKVAV